MKTWMRISLIIDLFQEGQAKHQAFIKGIHVYVTLPQRINTH